MYMANIIYSSLKIKNLYQYNIIMAFKSTMLFDVLANILQTKSMELYAKHIASEHFKDAAPFMIRRYLTMSLDPAVRDLVIDNYI